MKSSHLNLRDNMVQKFIRSHLTPMLILRPQKSFLLSEIRKVSL
jgi:hypothetical protein